MPPLFLGLFLAFIMGAIFFDSPLNATTGRAAAPLMGCLMLMSGIMVRTDAHACMHA